MKFTDEELSRILSAHEGGQLKAGGERWAETPLNLSGYSACVIQAAKIVSGPVAALRLNRRLAAAFDEEYERYADADSLLRWLESQGVT